MENTKYKADANDFPALVGNLHSKDDMFTGSYERYYNAGMSGLEVLEAALKSVDRTWGNINKCLDFPCGYGRVLRHLVRHVPANRITACDVAVDAVDFCVSEFGVHGIYSSENLDAVELGGPYDLIWIGSLFTHLPFQRSIQLMKLVSSVLTHSGLLVFSVVGNHCLERLLRSEGYAAGLLNNKQHQDSQKLAREYLEKGWCFVPYAGAEIYGLSFLSPAAILEMTCRRLNLPIRLIGFTEAAWNRDQDVYTFIRQDDSLLDSIART